MHYAYGLSALHPLIEPHIHEIIFAGASNLEASSAVGKRIQKIIDDHSQTASQLNFGKFLSNIQSNANELLSLDSKDLKYKIAGLVLFDCLLDVNYNDDIYMERRTEISRSLQVLLKSLKCTIETGEGLLRSVALCVGHLLAKVATPSELETLSQTYVTIAAELTKEQRLESSRLLGVLLINQVSMNAQHFVFQKRHGILPDLWTLVVDKNTVIRNASAEALGSMLALIAQRDALPEHLRQALKQIETGFSSSLIQKLAGSLLILDIIAGGTVVTSSELIEATKSYHSKDDGMHIDDLIWRVLMWKDTLEMDLKQSVIKLIPKLSVAFEASFLHQNEYTPPLTYLQFTIKFLLETIKQKKDRSIAYVSLGKLFVSMASYLRSSAAVEEIFLAISDGFKDPFCPAALECLGMVIGISPIFRTLVTNNLIDSVFHGGLTKDLISTLEVVFNHVPSVRRHIQVRLCNDITYVLQSNAVVLDEDNASLRGNAAVAVFSSAAKGQRSASNWGSPSKGIIRAIKGSKPQNFFGMSPFIPKNQIKSASSDEILVLALEVLESPLFFPRQIDQSVQLLRICYEYVVRYLDDYNAKIRTAAAVTSIAIVDKAASSSEVDSELNVLLPKIIDNLLMVGVGDDNSNIRFKIFSSLTPSLDQYISRSDCIHCLIDALNDESIKVRTAAISVLARAAHYDSVHIMPIILLSLRILLNLLQTSADDSTLRGGVSMLQSLVKGLGSFIVPYVKQVLRPLLDLLSNSSYEIVGEVLSTIGEVAIACPDLIHEHLDELFPSLIQALQDSSSISKQETAVVALGKLVTSLHVVNEPYTKYPGLFEGLVNAIQNTQEEAAELRQQAIKTAGLLGALEMGLFEKYMRAKTGNVGNVFAQDAIEDDDGEDADQGKTSEEVTDEDTLNKLDRYYLSIVIKSLMAILKDHSQAIHHQTAINICTRIVRNLGKRSHYQTDDIIDGIFARIDSGFAGGTNMLGSLIDFLVAVISSVGSQISKHYVKIVAFICSNMNQYQPACLSIIESLFGSVPMQDFTMLIRDIVPLFIVTMKQEPQIVLDDAAASFQALRNSGKFSSDDSETKSLPKTSLIIKTLVNIADGLYDYKIVLIPALLSIVSDTAVETTTRFDALSAMMHLVSDMELHQLVGRIIHPIVRLLSSPEVSLVEAALVSLSVLACRLGRSYEPFIVPVRRATKLLSRKEGIAKMPQLDEYEAIVGMIIKDRPLPKFPESATFIFPAIEDKRATVANKNQNESLPVSISMLETAWTLIGRSGASDFVDWYRRLTFEFIRQSPSSIIRQCTGLAKNYRPLAQELLNASFISLWDSICGSDGTVNNIFLNIPLIAALESALKNSNIPNNITSAILNLAEFMDLQDKVLPFDIRLLARNAEVRSGMPAKCVRYREMEFQSINVAPTTECVESLITMYHQLGFQDAAVGLTEFIKLKYPSISMQANWLEILNRYDHARQLYEEDNRARQADFDGDAPLDQLWLSRELGILRCLNHLGNFEELEAHALRLKRSINNVEQFEEKASWLSQIKVEEKVMWMSQIQHLGANAAWMLGHWNEMEEFTDAEYAATDSHVLENNTNFYKTIIAIQHRDYSKALSMIKGLRSTLSEHIGFSLNQNYTNAKRGMVSMQVLAEIEEVIEYSQIATKSADIDISGDQKFDPSVPILSYDIVSRKSLLLSKWQGRFKWVPKEVKVYRQILGVHTLVADPLEDLDSWLELVTLCRKERKFNLCENILRRLGAPLPSSAAVASDVELSTDLRVLRVIYACCKYQWDTDERQAALEGMMRLTRVHGDEQDPKMKTLKTFSLLRCADWMYDHDGYKFSEVLSYVKKARDLSPENYAVWHTWALFNYRHLQTGDTTVSEDLLHLNSDPSSEPNEDDGISIERTPSNFRRVNSYAGASLANLASNATDLADSYVIEAIKGFTRSLLLSQDQPIVNVLQDTLRLLTLWFSYAKKPEVFEVLKAEIEKVSADNWLSVLPQLIARMHIVTPQISGLLMQVLIKIAASHPQAVVCPILVAYNTVDEHQKAVAAEVIKDLRLKRSLLVDEATMVSKELLRVAITPHELWNDGLEKAAKFYVTDRSLDNMMTILFELHESLNFSGSTTEGVTGHAFIESMSKIGFTTLRDVSFRHSYSRDLTEAYDCLMKFRRTGRTTDLHQAWDYYHKVFKRISSQLKSFKTFNMNHVSPALCSAANLQLAVPGTYSSRELVTIMSFSTSIDVISSKQRPRKITMVGSDGCNYHFLLKGNEDLRQDERVMQLFGLINACLENDRSTRSRGLGIVRYSVLPLSNNSGVIGWVENCDTLNQLIRQYRHSKDLKINIEARLKLAKAPEYDRLMLMQKVDIFKQVQEETTGTDLAKMLWLKSKSSDVWVERRNNYTTSLAVMSMVGYILGLGDRHPSNLMLDRVSGRIVHIDFGDCFEVSMSRSVFPETVPFRLTRMMVVAMEAAGIDGTYRFTCERVMRVLRTNKDSLMAMLEAFVYDPLISWRLLVGPKFEFDHVDQADDADVNDSAVDIDHQVDMVRANSSDGAQLLGDNDHENPVMAPKSLAIVAQSMANDSRRRHSKVAYSDPEKRSFNDGATGDDSLNARAMEVIGRINAKLTGADFSSEAPLAIEAQVDELIKEATSVENLCQLFAGWCSLW